MNGQVLLPMVYLVANVNSMLQGISTVVSAMTIRSCESHIGLLAMVIIEAKNMKELG